MPNEIDRLMDLEKARVVWLLALAKPNGDCLECHLSKDKDGYAQVTVQYKNHRAHRLVYKHRKGDPGTLLVLHTCDNPSCINPEHLVIGTQEENIRQMIDKGRRFDNTNTTRAFDENRVLEVVSLYASGMSQYEIANKFRVNQSTVSLALKRYREENGHA